MKGTQQVIADTVSRAPLSHRSTANLSGEQIFLVQLEAMALDSSGISKVTQGNLQEQTAMDPEAISSHNDWLANCQNKCASIGATLLHFQRLTVCGRRHKVQRPASSYSKLNETRYAWENTQNAFWSRLLHSKSQGVPLLARWLQISRTSARQAHYVLSLLVKLQNNPCSAMIFQTAHGP